MVAELKSCTKCGDSKLRAEFHKCARARDGLQTWCKRCNCTARKAAYKRHPEKARAYWKILRNRNQQFILDYLLTHKCVDCKEPNPVLLDFDHVRGVKKFNVSKGTRCSIATLKQEIAKCDIRCVRCHRLRTADEAGWYRKLGV